MEIVRLMGKSLLGQDCFLLQWKNLVSALKKMLINWSNKNEIKSKRSFVWELLVLDYSLKRNSSRYLLYLIVFSILLLQVSGNCSTITHLLPKPFLGSGRCVSKVVYWFGLSEVFISLSQMECFLRFLLVSVCSPPACACNSISFACF